MAQPEEDAEQSADAAGHTWFPATELRFPGPYPAAVDVTQRQNFLSPIEFKEIFGVEKAEFAALNVWKQMAQRKKHGFW